mgnify:CR=1 FL=1|jgi:hypothetical protein
MTLHYVSAAFYDYYVNSITGTVTGTNTIFASFNNFLVPNYTDISFALVDTSAAPASIASATVSFTATTYGYTGRPAPSQIFTIWIFNGTGYTQMTNGTNVAWNNGTNTIALTPTEIGYINLVPNTTIFRVTVPDPGAGKSRVMQIDAYEKSTTACFRMEIKEPGGSVIHVMTS